MKTNKEPTVGIIMGSKSDWAGTMEHCSNTLKQFGIKQDDVIRIMRKHIKRKSFEIWRKRTSGRKTKHKSLVEIKLPRFKSSDQK